MIGTISSRTPEGEPAFCAVCNDHFFVEPSNPPGDAPCPRCGCLAWVGAPAEVRPTPGSSEVTTGPLWGLRSGPAETADSSLLDLVVSFDALYSELESLSAAVERAQLALAPDRPRAGFFRWFKRGAGRDRPRKPARTASEGGVSDRWIDG